MRRARCRRRRAGGSDVPCSLPSRESWTRESNIRCNGSKHDKRPHTVVGGRVSVGRGGGEGVVLVVVGGGQGGQMSHIRSLRRKPGLPRKR